MDQSFFAPIVGNPEPTSGHRSYDANKNEWYDSPGIIWAQIKIETTMGKVEGIENIFKPYEGRFSRGRLDNVRYKCYAVRHAKELYLKEESDEEKRLSSGVMPSTGVEVTEANINALYLVEAFLFQVKSTLDVLSLLLNALSAPIKVSGFHDKGIDLIKILSKDAKKFAQLIALIEKDQSWISQLVNERDKVAHSNSIKALWFVQKIYTGGQSIEIEYPKMPTGERIKEYIEITEVNLLSFIEKFLKSLGV